MKNIIITGVSNGLGFETSKKLLENNYFVYGISRTINENIELLKKTYKNNFKHKVYDLSDVDNIKKEIFEDFLNEKKEIHCFINNAAIAYDDIITNLNIDSLNKMYKINVLSPIIFSKFVIRNFILNKTKGSLVNISSVCAHTGYKGLSMYASTKGSIEAFSKNIAREWGEYGIRSNCIVAGFMETNMSNNLTKQQKDRIYNRTSLKEATNIDSVVNTIIFLVSDESKSITGQNIFVDSGTI